MKYYKIYETQDHIICELNGGVNSRLRKDCTTKEEQAKWQIELHEQMDAFGHVEETSHSEYK